VSVNVSPVTGPPAFVMVTVIVETLPGPMVDGVNVFSIVGCANAVADMPRSIVSEPAKLTTSRLLR